MAAYGCHKTFEATQYIGLKLNSLKCPLADTLGGPFVQDLISLAAQTTGKGRPFSASNAVHRGFSSLSMQPNRKMADNTLSLHLAVAAALAFESRDVVEEQLEKHWSGAKYHSLNGPDEEESNDANCGFMAYDSHSSMVIAFRGYDASTLGDHFATVGVEQVNEGGLGFHSGLHKSAKKLWNSRIRGHLQMALNKGLDVYLCGHSIGGALALIIGSFIALNESMVDRVKAIVTFGAPRVGDENLSDLLQERISKLIHYQVGEDFGPRFPPRDRHLLPLYAPNPGKMIRVAIDDVGDSLDYFVKENAPPRPQDTMREFTTMRFGKISAKGKSILPRTRSADASLWMAFAKALPTSIMHSLPVVVIDAIRCDIDSPSKRERSS